MIDFQGTEYIDALRFESDPETRLHEIDRILFNDKLVQPGSDESWELGRMRLQARKEIMGEYTGSYKQGFSKEANELNYQEAMKAGK